MLNLALLICCLFAGFVLRRTTLFDERSPIVLNNLIIYFFIPVLTLHHVPGITFQLDLIWLSLTPIIAYLGSFLFVKLIALFQRIDSGTEGALIMTSGIGSTSFVGFPIFEILYGGEGLALGIILSLAGTVMVFNTLGLGTGLYYSNSSKDPWKFLGRLLRFPPLIVFFISILLNVLQFEMPEVIAGLLEKLSAPFSVVALLAIGIQIEINIDKDALKYLFIGHFYKLILAPILIYLLMWYLLDIQSLLAKICIMGAGIGSMNAVSILAAQLGLNPKLASLMPALSIPLSIPILFLIDLLLS